MCRSTARNQGPHRAERVVGQLPGPDEIPDRGRQCVVLQRADSIGELSEEQGSSVAECSQYLRVQRGEREILTRRRQQQRGELCRIERDPAIVTGERTLAG